MAEIGGRTFLNPLKHPRNAARKSGQNSNIPGCQAGTGPAGGMRLGMHSQAVLSQTTIDTLIYQADSDSAELFVTLQSGCLTPPLRPPRAILRPLRGLLRS